MPLRMGLAVSQLRLVLNPQSRRLLCPSAYPQFVQLPRLAELELEDCAYTGDSMAPLSRLAGSLTLVRLADCCLPDSLHQLSRLQHLNLWECFADEGDTRSMINDALEHLTQLTFLVGHGGGGGGGGASVMSDGQHGAAMPGSCASLAPQPMLALVQWHWTTPAA